MFLDPAEGPTDCWRALRRIVRCTTADDTQLIALTARNLQKNRIGEKTSETTYR